jgi:predicted dehydrogenase
MNLSVGIIGSGSMGKWHTYGYDRINEFYRNEFTLTKKVICSRNLEKLEKANEQLKWQECATDWKEVVNRPDIDIIDICTPDYLHFEIAKAAILNKKHVICEKPLAFTDQEALELCELAASNGVNHATMHNYRYFQSLAVMKGMIDSGAIGNIVHIHASFIMDWAVNPNIPMFWRFDHTSCPLGILGDLGSHLIDYSRYIGLTFDHASGVSSTAIKERLNASKEYVPVKNEDIVMFTTAYTSGALGYYEISRVSGGRGRNGLVFEVHGTHGNIKYESAHFNDLSLSIGSEYGEKGEYRRYHSNELRKTTYPWSDSGEFVQSDSFTLLIYDFLNSIKGNGTKHPTFLDGFEVSKVISLVRNSIHKMMEGR